MTGTGEYLPPIDAQADEPTEAQRNFDQLFPDGEDRILGVYHNQARKLCAEYGDELRGEFLSALLHARDQGPEKVKEVVGILDQHYKVDLQFVHPEIRHSRCDMFHRNVEETFFIRLFTTTLNLKPSASQPN